MASDDTKYKVENQSPTNMVLLGRWYVDIRAPSAGGWMQRYKRSALSLQKRTTSHLRASSDCARLPMSRSLLAFASSAKTPSQAVRLVPDGLLGTVWYSPGTRPANLRAKARTHHISAPVLTEFGRIQVPRGSRDDSGCVSDHRLPRCWSTALSKVRCWYCA